MGTLTLTELKDEVTAGLGNRTDVASRLTRLLNLAQQRLARTRDFAELRTSDTVSISNTSSESDGVLSIPNLRAIYSLRLKSGLESWKLNGWTQRRFDRWMPNKVAVTRGKPVAYMRWGNSVEIIPLPDTTYTIARRFSSWPTAFSDATPSAVSDFDRKDDVLIELAIAQFYWSLGKEDEAAKHERRAAAILGEALSEDLSEPDTDIVPHTLDQDTRDVEGVPYWQDPFKRDQP